MEQDLVGLRVAVLATDGVEEVEVSAPTRALREAGARVDLVAPHGGEIQAMHGMERSRRLPVDRTLHEARPEEYDALLLPGGALNADALRMDARARALVRAMDRADRPIAFLCHAGWILVSAGLVQGRTLTGWPSIQDDVRNAGGEFLDREVVVDRNFVSSRGPRDIPAFSRAMVERFARARRPGG